MSQRTCLNGHSFEKTSDCPVCPICSSEEMKNKYGAEFPKIGAPAFRALDSAGIKQLTYLTKYTEKQLLQLHGFGPKALRVLKNELKSHDLSFKQQ